MSGFNYSNDHATPLPTSQRRQVLVVPGSSLQWLAYSMKNMTARSHISEVGTRMDGRWELVGHLAMAVSLLLVGQPKPARIVAGAVLGALYVLNVFGMGWLLTL